MRVTRGMKKRPDKCERRDNFDASFVERTSQIVVKLMT